jgi:hypothetical protein
MFKGCMSGAMEKSQPFQSGLPGSWINTCAAGIFGSFDAEVIFLSPILKWGRNASTVILTFVFGTTSSDPIATVYSFAFFAALSSTASFTADHFAATSFGTMTARSIFGALLAGIPAGGIPAPGIPDGGIPPSMLGCPGGNWGLSSFFLQLVNENTRPLTRINARSFFIANSSFTTLCDINLRALCPI